MVGVAQLNIGANNPYYCHDFLCRLDPSDQQFAAFYKYVDKNLKYPRAGKKIKVLGKVFVEFVVTSDGSKMNP